MSTTWSDVHVKCPFYKSENGNDINCENILNAGQICRHRFAVKADKLRHLNRCCCSQFEKCLYYRAMITVKYNP